MAEHKAATDVTIAPLAEKTFFEELVSKYWLPALGVAMAFTGWTLWGAYAKDRSQSEMAASWTELFDATGTPEEYAGFIERFSNDPAAPWAQLMAVTGRINDKDYEGANQALQALKSDYGSHPLVTDAMDFGDGREARSLVDQLAETIDAQIRWESEHPELFENPAPPEGAKRVKLETDAGDIVVALYETEAPNHVANFLSLCESGYYDGTLFHRVMPNFMIQGGDPNSRDEDRTTWGQGGPDEKLPPEANDLYHFEGVLSAAKAPGETDSSGSQFFLTVGAAHHLDGQHVIFGAIVEGQDVAKQISEGAIAEGTSDQPQEPVTLKSTTVL